MKVCILTTAFPRWPGDDRGVFILNAAKAIQQQGISVIVLGIHSPGALDKEVIEGVDVIRTRYLPEKFEILQSEGGGLPVVWNKHFLARFVLVLFIITQSIAVVKFSKDCDLIHANWTLSGVIAWITKQIHKKPYIVMAHGSDIYMGGKIGILNILVRRVISASNGLVAISNSIREDMQRLQFQHPNLHIIPETFDPTKFSTTENTKRESVILFVGSLISRKGVDVLIDAFSDIHSCLKDYKLVIIGEGKEDSNLKLLAQQKGIFDKVLFLGRQSQIVVAEWMRKAKIFVLPSREEGLGVVLLEACASKTPCIGSNVGGIPDILGDGTGILVPPNDPQALSSSIYRLLTEDDLWKNIQRSAHKKVLNNFSAFSIGLRYKQLYEQALNSR